MVNKVESFIKYILERQRTLVNNQLGANMRDLAERRSPTDRTKRGGAENYAHLKLLT